MYLQRSKKYLCEDNESYSKLGLDMNVHKSSVMNLSTGKSIRRLTNKIYQDIGNQEKGRDYKERIDK